MTIDYDKAQRQQRYNQKKKRSKKNKKDLPKGERAPRKISRPKINWENYDDMEEDELFELYE